MRTNQDMHPKFFLWLKQENTYVKGSVREKMKGGIGLMR